MRRRIIIPILIAIAVTGCQKKASGQTVAVVNNEEITSSDLNAELATQKLSATDATQEARNEALQRLINRRLLEQQARTDGLDKSPEFLNQQRRLTENLLIEMFVGKHMNTAQVPTQAEIDQFEAAHPGMFAKREMWTLQQIIYPLQKDAALKAKITAANSLDEVAQVLTAAGVQFTKATRQIDTAILPPAIYSQIIALKPGEPFIVPGPDKAAASAVAARQPAPLPDDKARQVALAGLRRDQVNKFITDRVQSLKATAKIQYQPGFGPPAKTPGS